MKVLITGINGYLGSRLSAFLSNKGNEIIGLCSRVLDNEDLWKKHISSFIIGDIREELIIEKIKKCNPDAIIHLVSLDHNESEGSVSYVNSINVLPIWEIHRKLFNSNVNKFIYFSTIHVYGSGDMKNFLETEKRLSPTNVYGLTHLLSEEINKFYGDQSGKDIINIRLSNCYGEPIINHQKCWNTIINSMVLNAFQKKAIVLKSDGQGYRDFLHYSDVCKGVNQLLNTTISSHDTINFSSSRSYKIIDAAVMVQNIFKEKYGNKIPIYINEIEELDDSYHCESPEEGIPNMCARSLGINFLKTLEGGIYDLFSYLDQNI